MIREGIPKKCSLNLGNAQILGTPFIPLIWAPLSTFQGQRILKVLQTMWADPTPLFVNAQIEKPKLPNKFK